MQLRVLSFDLETFLITDTDKAPKPVVCSWSWDGISGWLSLPEDDSTLQLIADPQNIFVGANIAYDVGVMMRWRPETIPFWVRAYDEGRVFDIAIREQLHHLQAIGERDFKTYIGQDVLEKKYLGIDRSDDKHGQDIWRTRYGTLYGVPLTQWPEEAKRYALDDSVLAHRVFQAQGGPEAAVATEGLQLQAALALHLTSVWGFYTNQENVLEMERWLTEEIAAADDKLAEYTEEIDGKPCGLTGKGSQKVVANLVARTWYQHHMQIIEDTAREYQVGYDMARLDGFLSTDVDMGLLLEQHHSTPAGIAGEQLVKPFASMPPWCWDYRGWNPVEFLNELRKRIKPIPRSTKGPKVGEKDIADIVHLNPLLKVRADRAHWNKMLDTYVKPYKGKATIHARFNAVVSTGRTSCDGPNLQNIPERPKGGDQREKFRKSLRARPGHKLGTVDQSALELVTLAATIRYRYGHSDMAEAINNGQDLHCLMAASMTGRQYHEYISGKDEDGKDKVIKEAPFKAERQAAKAFSFGKPGGLGRFAMQAYMKSTYGVEKSIDEIKQMDKAYRRQWPEVVRYLRDHGDLCDSCEERRGTAWNNSGRTKANCTYTQMSNYPFQSLAADGMKDCLWQLCKHHLLGWFWTEAPHATQMLAVERLDPQVCAAQQHEYHGSPLRRSHTVNFVHDEIVDEHPDDLAEEAFALQKEIMVDTMARWTYGVRPSVEGDLSVEWQH